MSRRIGLLAGALLGCALSVWTAAAAEPAAAGAAARAPSRVLVLVDKTVYPDVKTGLETYFADVRKLMPVDFKVLAEDFYHMKPVDIRARLKTEYTGSKPPVVGAIMCGPIPYALRGGTNPGDLVTCLPYYYEDFDAKWYDDNADGVEDRCEQDRANNPAEIWTAWWVPPSDDRAEQTKLLQGFLTKLDRHYKGQTPARDGMIFLEGNGNSVEITEAWYCLLSDAMKSTGQKMAKVFSADADADMNGLVAPPPGKSFVRADLENELYSHSYQHLHTVTHGSPDGIWVSDGRVSFDMSKFHDTGAVIFTTSGCGNGNFHGSYRVKPDYANSIGDRLIFAPNCLTIAYYGATTPQSTGVFAIVHTPLGEFLDPEKGTGIGEGYLKLLNSDVCWGTSHYLFRGGDGKALLGDPFARYTPVPPAPGGATAAAGTPAAQ